MIIYVNGKEFYPKNFEDLSNILDTEKELYIGKCIVCGIICNNKLAKSGKYVCSPECMGG